MKTKIKDPLTGLDITIKYNSKRIKSIFVKCPKCDYENLITCEKHFIKP